MDQHEPLDSLPVSKLVPWSTGDAFQGLAVVVAGSIVALLLVGWLVEGDEAEGSTAVIPLAISILPALMIAAVWFFGIKRHGARWRTLGFVRSRNRFSLVLPWLALFLSLAFSSLYAYAVSAVGIDALLPKAVPSAALGEGPYRALNILSIGVTGPLAEEVFYRGFLLAAFVQSLGMFRGAVVVSAIFAVSHVAPAVMIPFFVSGLLLSWLYLKTGSILPPFTAHAAQNIITLSAISLAG